MSNIIFSYKLFNPLFWHIRAAMRDEDIRYIWNRGGSSSGKSVSTAQAVVFAVFNGEGSALVIRKVATSLKNTVYQEFKSQICRLKLADFFEFKENNITCHNGQKIDFTGLDDPEKIKSITGYRWVVMEETTEFQYEDFTQVRFRLRGKKGLQIICNFNPDSEDSWIKKKILDTYQWDDLGKDMGGKIKNSLTGQALPKEYSMVLGKKRSKTTKVLSERTGKLEDYKGDTIEIHSSYKNNFWVVSSPCGKYGYYDRQTISNYQWYKDHDYNFYRVYALGEWGSIKTGGEYLHAFDSNRHIKTTTFNKNYPIHISIDNNVLPYISVSFIQIIGKDIRQCHEICAEEPFNTVSKASQMTVTYLSNIGYQDIVYLYGDASTKNSNTIDDEKRSFLDKFIEGIEKRYNVEERLPDSNPSVSMSGEFVNYILQEADGFSFAVDDSCRNSICDYNNAKKDVNGGILKTRIKNKVTKQSYEQYGHLTDCLRYVICQAFKTEFIKFSNKRKHNDYKNDDMKYYNSIPDGATKVIFCYPDLNGKFVSFCANITDRVYISDVLFTEDYVDAQSYMKVINPDYSIFECEKPYFHVIRELREVFGDIRCYTQRKKSSIIISAHEENIKNKFRFRGDYDEDNQYAEFMNNILDYNGKDNYEALYALSCASHHIIRNHIAQVQT